jgi:spore coat polysaccharide biosynthesis protein SpsF (cytidylyltransferase family)
MRIGLFITARMGSKRLANKHFIKLGDKTAIDHLISSISAEMKGEISSNQAIVKIVTGNEKGNKNFEQVAKTNHISIFYGDDNNIPLRHLQAAKSDNIESIISIDGDDIFCASEAIRAIYEALESKQNLVFTAGLPLGMNAWGYSVSMLEAAIGENPQTSLDTGWAQIFKRFKHEIIDIHCPGAEKVRATLDYKQDKLFFQKCAYLLKDKPMMSSTELVQKILASNLHLINSALGEDYWLNFNHEQKQQEVPWNEHKE